MLGWSVTLGATPTALIDSDRHTEAAKLNDRLVDECNFVGVTRRSRDMTLSVGEHSSSVQE